MIAPAHRPFRVFIDTGGYFALTSSKDQNHAAAVAIMQALIAGRFRLYTSNFVLAELHALLLTRISREIALATLMAIDASDMAIVRVARDDEARARQIIAQYDDKSFSLTDASSFAIMDRLGITRAFTFDVNFAQYGLTALTPTSFR